MRTLDLAKLRQTRGVNLGVWPPRYDPSYRPAAEEPCWLPEIEYAPPALRDEIILGKPRSQLDYAGVRWCYCNANPKVCESLPRGPGWDCYRKCLQDADQICSALAGRKISWWQFDLVSMWCGDVGAHIGCLIACQPKEFWRGPN